MGPSLRFKKASDLSLVLLLDGLLGLGRGRGGGGGRFGLLRGGWLGGGGRALFRSNRKGRREKFRRDERRMGR